MSEQVPTPNGLPQRIEIELLALDLTTCVRCTQTSRNIDVALGQVASELKSAGVGTIVTKTVIMNEAQAESLRFASSPTIRVNGRDIALETRESPCSDCLDLCGCGSGVACRVWVWQGQAYEAAPVEMIADAIRRASDKPRRAPDEQRFVVPENLRRFFGAVSGKTPDAAPGCCTPGAPVGAACACQ